MDLTSAHLSKQGLAFFLFCWGMLGFISSGFLFRLFLEILFVFSVHPNDLIPVGHDRGQLFLPEWILGCTLTRKGFRVYLFPRSYYDILVNFKAVKGAMIIFQFGCEACRTSWF